MEEQYEYNGEEQVVEGEEEEVNVEKTITKVFDYEQDLFKSLVHSEKNKIEKSSNLYSKLGLSRLESYGKNQ